jgi:hypothetical protein
VKDEKKLKLKRKKRKRITITIVPKHPPQYRWKEQTLEKYDRQDEP